MGYEVDFLPVGNGEKSGDAIALRYGNLTGSREEQTVIVIDGGFKDSGEALVKHIRSHYGTNEVDVVLSTHPDDDHTSGLKVVLEEMEVRELWMHQPWNHTERIADFFRHHRVTDNSVSDRLWRSLKTARILEEIAGEKGIPIIEPFSGTYHTTVHGTLMVLGPTTEFYESLLPHWRTTPEATEGKGILETIFQKAGDVITRVAESLHIETLTDEGETAAENNSSAITLLTVGDHQMLFTGDAGIPALTPVADLLERAPSFDFGALKFMQVPHHGSKRNIGPTLLSRFLGPKLGTDEKLRIAYVSASKEGNPKHPSKKVTNAFRRRGAHVHATQGVTKRHSHNAPVREGWSASEAIPFYSEVEE